MNARADDDLDLLVFVDDAGGSRKIFQAFLIDDALAGVADPQTCCAVRDVRDVLHAA